MYKRDTHIFFVEQTNSPSVLLIGFKGVFLEVLVEYLTRYGCDVYQKSDQTKNIKFSYLFQKNNLNQLTKSMTLTNNHDARFILLVTTENHTNFSKIEESIDQIKGNIETYLFSYPEPANHDQAKKIIDEIFLKIFAGENHGKGHENKLSLNSTNKNTPVIVAPKKKITFNPPLFILSIALTVLLGSVIYFGSIFLSFYYGAKNLDQASKEFLNGNLVSSKKNADQAFKLFSFGDKIASFFLPLGKTVNYGEAKTIEDSFHTTILLSKTISEAIYIASLAQNIGESLVSSRTTLHSSQLDNLKTEMKELNNNVSLLIAQTRSMQKNNSRIYRYLQAQQQLNKGEEILNQVKELLSLSTKFTEVLPEVLGYDKPKTFLLLFQNNSELRPTGGFIGSFGWITFANGRLIDFKTEDVYTADGQLKGHVPPPEPIKKYLQENWYLRDSNFDPDFLISAQQAEWFLKHEMNLSFDGVFAFDLNSVQAILKGIEGVYLSDYGETITADNLFLKTQAASEIGFFPGSTQKRDFIGSLGRAIFIKLTTNKIAWAKLIKEVKNSLDNKHTLLYFHNDLVQQLVEGAGWAGRIASVSCKKSGCIPDYLMLVEANFGINKANFLLERTAKLIISFSGDNLLHELTVNYSNESPGQVYPGGPYFSYTRILLPKEALVTEILTEGETLKKEDVLIEQYQDKVSVAFPFKVPASSNRKIHLVYRIPIVVKTDSNLELFVQKQPGINSFTLDISINKTPSKSFNISGDQLISLSL